MRVAGSEHLFAAAGAGSGGLAFEEWIAGAAAFADLGGDVALAERVAERVAAVAAVGPELLGLVAGGAERVDQRQQVRAFVLVAGADTDREWGAVGVDR